MPASLDVANAQVALLGVPHDGGTTYQPGARLAPYHVRRVSALIQNHHPIHDVDVFTRLRCVDVGNIVFPPFDRAAMRSAIEAEIRQLVAAEITPFVVGGDPAFAPGTGTPVPGGLTAREALGLVRGLAGLDVRGGDVVEVCPALDHADITSHLAAHLLWEMLALVALRAV